MMYIHLEAKLSCVYSTSYIYVNWYKDNKVIIHNSAWLRYNEAKLSYV